MNAENDLPENVHRLPGQSPDKEEDPSLLVLPDGSVWAFFFTNRSAEGRDHPVRDLVASRFVDGAFGPLVDVTTGPDLDVYPNAVLDSEGTLHLCWMRRLDGFELHDAPAWIAYRRFDARTLEPLGPEEDVTAPGRNTFTGDWIPSIGLAPDGSVVIVYARSNRATASGHWELWWSRRTGDDWSQPERLPVDSAEDHDTLPMITRIDGRLALGWTRHPSHGQPFAWERADSELMLAWFDGVSWTPAEVLVGNPNGDVPNLFISFFEDHAGTWRASWQRVEGGRHSVQSVPVLEPRGAWQELPLSIHGWDPRIARIPGDEYLAVSVWKGPGATEMDVVSQVFRLVP